MQKKTKKTATVDELCERAMPKIEWVARTKYSRSPVPGQTMEDIKQTVITRLIDHWRKVGRGQAPGGELEEEERLLQYVAQAAFNTYNKVANKARADYQVDSYDDPDSPLRFTLQAHLVSPDEHAAIRETLERVRCTPMSRPKISRFKVDRCCS